MTEAERLRLTIAYCREHEAEWAAYLAEPLSEREAITDKVEATYQQHGVQAARNMMRALGMPMVPDELCDPVEVQEAKQATGEDREWMYTAMAGYGVSREEVDAALDEPAPVGRVDH